MEETSNNKDFENLKNIWVDFIGITPENYKEKLVDKLIKDLGVFKNGIGVSALTIFDIEKNKFLYVDDDIERVTGISIADYFDKGVSFIFSRAIIEHIPLLINSTLKQRVFFYNKPQSYFENFIVNREYAYKQKNKPASWVLHQVVKHLFNSSGKLFAIVALQTQLKHTNYLGKFRFYIYDKKQNTVVYPKYVVNTKISQLTDREKEIILLLLQNKNNKAIAEALHISYHTVRTHRKSAMKKLKCHSIYELAREYSILLHRD